MSEKCQFSEYVLISFQTSLQFQWWRRRVAYLTSQHRLNIVNKVVYISVLYFIIYGMLLFRRYRTTTTILWPFFRDYPGELVPEEKLLDFMVQGKIKRGRHTDHPAGRRSIGTNQCPPPLSPIFYRSDALPTAQPTVSKHWRQLAHSD